MIDNRNKEEILREVEFTKDTLTKLSAMRERLGYDSRLHLDIILCNLRESINLDLIILFAEFNHTVEG